MASKKDDKKSVSEDESKPSHYQKIDRRTDKQERAKTGPSGELDEGKLDPSHRTEGKGHPYL